MQLLRSILVYSIEGVECATLGLKIIDSEAGRLCPCVNIFYDKSKFYISNKRLNYNSKFINQVDIKKLVLPEASDVMYYPGLSLRLEDIEQQQQVSSTLSWIYGYKNEEYALTCAHSLVPENLLLPEDTDKEIGCHQVNVCILTPWSKSSSLQPAPPAIAEQKKRWLYESIKPTLEPDQNIAYKISAGIDTNETITATYVGMKFGLIPEGEHTPVIPRHLDFDKCVPYTADVGILKLKLTADQHNYSYEAFQDNYCRIKKVLPLNSIDDFADLSAIDSANLKVRLVTFHDRGIVKGDCHHHVRDISVPFESFGFNLVIRFENGQCKQLPSLFWYQESNQATCISCRKEICAIKKGDSGSPAILLCDPPQEGLLIGFVSSYSKGTHIAGCTRNDTASLLALKIIEQA